MLVTDILADKTQWLTDEKQSEMPVTQQGVCATGLQNSGCLLRVY